MVKRKLTDAELAKLRREYEAWNPRDPHSETADQLARRHGITKQTLYLYRKRWLREDQTRQQMEREATHVDLQPLVRLLTDQLVEARLEIKDLRGRLDFPGRYREA